MVDVFAGVAGFKAMFDTAKNLIGMNEAVARNTAVIGLQEQILSARESYSALLEEKRELEEKVTSFETWESEKQRYELKEHGERLVLAYALKKGVEPPEHPHSICPDCYQKRKKSLLQTEHHFVGQANRSNAKFADGRPTPKGIEGRKMPRRGGGRQPIASSCPGWGSSLPPGLRRVLLEPRSLTT
jgi:hypothetical protein